VPFELRYVAERLFLRSASDPVQNILAALVGRNFLAHLAVLYKLHTHEYLPAGGETPSMERMCDVFEAFVAAVAVDFGEG
jgi:dsRNA-specific ribonuclease